MLLELEQLHAFYGLAPAIHGVDISVDRAEAVVLLGPNGAGKTTILRAVSRVIRTTGRIDFDGKSIAKRSTESVAALGVGHVPEGRGTFADLTVDENLRLGGMARPRIHRSTLTQDRQVLIELFPILHDMRHRRAGRLSGGQQQILAVARALLGRPRLLMLDEVSLGLAPLVTREIFAKLADLTQSWDLALLIAEQNVAMVRDLATRGYLIESGLVAAQGALDDLLSSTEVSSAYLGISGGTA